MDEILKNVRHDLSAIEGILNYVEKLAIKDPIQTTSMSKEAKVRISSLRDKLDNYLSGEIISHELSSNLKALKKNKEISKKESLTYLNNFHKNEDNFLKLQEWG